ncbi:putative quinol monooxygenase [Roseivirga sp. E12]|uniref:putative quinol monooxygenase n=1 Tax=Roseivirga sp. E12 TaxID=2819237 RepID=UPI001ABCC2FB|nr:antibiotic biosynthesis monooxygenase family protein [Roseivirga sp. E12]MBO3700200.1 antibiotic biosynthesis monooxygenase [Roseivirga sp. E12]
MLIRIVRMTFRPEERDAFLSLFDEKKENIRHFAGCSHLELLEDYSDSNVFSTYSYWEDEEALNAYRNSDLFAEVWTNTKSKFAAKPVAFSLKKFVQVD